jgi:hypothetical protein
MGLEQTAGRVAAKEYLKLPKSQRSRFMRELQRRDRDLFHTFQESLADLKPVKVLRARVE